MQHPWLMSLLYIIQGVRPSVRDPELRTPAIWPERVGVPEVGVLGEGPAFFAAVVAFKGDWDF